ncbi:MAG TPA: efflux RND transporter periplasmic adaptor subunit [Gemmataceae bacterium]|nr:efflux RND transporter periplasmic adaptor subunit [Gemmataceae bacterium]
MPTRIQNLPAMLLVQLPTVLTLAVLGGVAWLGIHFDWKLPPLPALLGGRDAKKAEEAKKEEDGKEDPSKLDKLPLVNIASADVSETAGIRTAAVERRQVGEYVTANGDIDFDQNHYAHLSTLASGKAWSVHKQPGDAVKKGDVLALIAAPELARLKFDLQQTLLQVDTRERVYRRLKSTDHAVSLQAIDSAESSLREARIRQFGDEQSLKNLGVTVHVEELTKLTDEQVAARLRTLGIPDTLLQQLDRNTLTSNLLPMIAPFDGVVVKRDIVIGEMVNTTTPQFVLADLSHLWIMLHVRQEDIRKLKEGQEVRFHLNGSNEDAPPATITRISPEMDEKTRTVTVRAEVTNPTDKGRLLPHTFGTARIRVGQTEQLIVPNEAVQFDGQSHLLFVRGGSATEFQPMRVKLGTPHDKFMEIVSGVEAGQTIATTGSHVLLSELLKKRIGGED